MECREMGYDIKRVSRMRRPVVQLAQEPQLA
jgi:hypothetical protein